MVLSVVRGVIRGYGSNARVGKLTRDPIRDRAHAGRACGLRSGPAPAPTPGGDAAGVACPDAARVRPFPAGVPKAGPRFCFYGMGDSHVIVF